MLLNEAIEKITETIDDAEKLYGERWDSALVGGDSYHHAITSEQTQDVVVRAADDSLNSSWLCDYLEAVSPGNVRLLLARIKELEQREMACSSFHAAGCEPVAWRWRWSDDAEGCWRYTEEQRETRGSVTAQPLYTAPPAPVAVPDEWRMMCGEWRDEALSIHDASGLIVSGVDANVAGVIVEAHNACRAAMLKAGPVTGWIKCSERMPPENDQDIWLWNGSVQSGYIWNGDRFVDWNEEYQELRGVTHWMPMPLPAAPEQEV